MIVIDSKGTVVGTTLVGSPLPTVRIPRDAIEIEGRLYSIVVLRAPSSKGTTSFELSALMLPEDGDPARLPGWQPVAVPGNLNVLKRGNL